MGVDFLGIADIGIVFAKRWIAGVRLEDAITRARELNKYGESVTINYLGEHVSDPRKVEKTVLVYEALLRRMHYEDIRGSISLKPTQLGLYISSSLFRRNYRRIASDAKRYGIFAWLDMEDGRYTDATIASYLKIHREYSNSGIAIQANLRRSSKDAEMIAGRRGVVRLVKGAYKEDVSIAYGSRKEVDDAYIRIMRYLFMHSSGFTIATHDMAIIKIALALERKSDAEVSFSMLNGINNEYAKQLAKKSKVDVYVPFGEEWLPYAVRRLRSISNIKRVLSSLLTE